MTPQPMTTVQKIIARAAGKAWVGVGDYVDCTPDYLVNQELVWPVHKRNLDRLGIERLQRPDKFVLVVDHTTSATMGSKHPATHRLLKNVAKQYDITNFFGPGTGLRHLLMVEKGFARPGLLVFSDEGNIASIGAVGAVSIPMTTDIVAVLATGKNWVSVPATVKITLTGALRHGVTARDVAQTLIRDFSSSGKFADCCLEFGGPGLATLNMDERQTILACVYHTGADTALMEVDAVALDYVHARADGREMHFLAGDAGAQLAMEITCDLSCIEPMITVPPHIDAVRPVSELVGKKIDQATIGSCAGNRLEDMRAGAAVLKDRHIADHVTMYISPGSAEVYAQSAREGLLEIFANAGATVLPPGCNTCWGYHGVLTGDEVSISTHQFNYQGRNGSRDAAIYLSSAAVVAASAVAGEIACAPDAAGLHPSLPAGAPAFQVVDRALASGTLLGSQGAGSAADAVPFELEGRVWKFGDDICGDDGIIDFSAVAKGFGEPFDEATLKSMCFTRYRPEFPTSVHAGDIVVAGKNFAHQNHVEVSAAIRLSGVSAVVAESCESALVRRALSQGLAILVAPGITDAVEDGDTLRVDPSRGVVTTSSGKTFFTKPFSPRMVEILRAGSLIASLGNKPAACLNQA
jgi:3-isopropylmalate/(R)-2-methylmalate dehydratase large subunit